MITGAAVVHDETEMALQAKIGSTNMTKRTKKNGSSSIRTRSLTRKVIDNNDDDGDDTNFITLTTRNIHFG
ncbi:hypothetical protein DERP_008426 [Dermatophagoides pteronyssinus]|uniref:Uncharacterized protein n=1 Tax=Dermatophagoides pteronyssinus TaxID=6956 RepID=A0ABQ8IV86_DERPT|nr:hypothetical protein DERP_008426 [Dermatophagoides pteronyssinus]